MIALGFIRSCFHYTDVTRNLIAGVTILKTIGYLEDRNACDSSSPANMPDRNELRMRETSSTLRIVHADCRPHSFQDEARDIPDQLRDHHDYELHLIRKAQAWVRVGDEMHRFTTGAVVLIGPQLPHSLGLIESPHDGRTGGRHVLRFAEEQLRKAIEIFPELREVEALLERARSGIEFIGFGARATSHLNNFNETKGIARFIELSALLLELARWSGFRLLSSAQRRVAKPSPCCRAVDIYKVCDYLKEEYSASLTLAKASSMAGMSEAMFSRHFRQVVGSNFTEFVIGLRIAQACRLLLRTRKEVSSICYEVGFNNISNFNRHFLKRKRVTPSEYRRCAGTSA